MTLTAIIAATGRALARLAQRMTEEPPEFTCADCDRQASCGLPPSKDCLYKLMMQEDRRLRTVRAPRSVDYIFTRRPL